MQATVKQELIVRLVFSFPLRRNKLSTLDRYRCRSAEVQCVKMRWMRKTRKRRRRGVEDHGGRKGEKRTRRRRITRRKTRRKEREQKEPPWAANKKCVSTGWKVKPSKGFFLSMPLTQKALTYQTRAHWALCPLITDFLQAADGGIGLLCFCSLAGADKSFSDHWMHAGTPALWGYCISLYQNHYKHSAEKAQSAAINRTPFEKETKTQEQSTNIWLSVG